MGLNRSGAGPRDPEQGVPILVYLYTVSEYVATGPFTTCAHTALMLNMTSNMAVLPDAASSVSTYLRPDSPRRKPLRWDSRPAQKRPAAE